MIKTSESMKIIIHAIYKTIPSIINLGVIVCFVILVIAVNTLAKWKGSFYTCKNGDLIVDVLTRSECISKGGTWTNQILHYDNLTFSGLLFLFIIMGSHWLQILYSCIDSVGEDRQPIYNNDLSNIFIFYIFILFGSILLFNLFIGVVIDNFKQMKEILGGYLLLNSEQREWVDLQRFILRKNLKIILKKPGNFVWGVCFDVANSQYLEIVVFLIIILNYAIMITVYQGMTETHEQAVFVINAVTLVVYNVEILIKIGGFRLFFFKDSWNL